MSEVIFELKDYFSNIFYWYFLFFIFFVHFLPFIYRKKDLIYFSAILLVTALALPSFCFNVVFFFFILASAGSLNMILFLIFVALIYYIYSITTKSFIQHYRNKYKIDRIWQIVSDWSLIFWISALIVFVVDILLGVEIH